MAVGFYTTLFESAISPWTTLGPLAFVMSISLMQEGAADLGRHQSDSNTNNFPCVVLRRVADLEPTAQRETTVRNGRDVRVQLNKNYYSNRQTPRAGSVPAPDPTHTCDVAFERVKRMNIRQGHLVLVRNRDMIPADLIMLASSSDNGNAYIETSSIDGETNLKLRSSPQLPKSVMRTIREEGPHDDNNNNNENDDQPKVFRETLEQATKRITRMTALGYPNGMSALTNPANPEAPQQETMDEAGPPSSGLNLMRKTSSVFGGMASATRRESSARDAPVGGEGKYVAALNSEPPNASVNTYSGVLLMPPVRADGPSIEVPLNAENILLRGAVLRNTEWVIGMTCFTGKDTKLVRNSFETPSKFSQLDQLMNRTVVFILVVMILCISYLASWSVWSSNEFFDELWCVIVVVDELVFFFLTFVGRYVRFNTNVTEPWPYLPELDPPAWTTQTQNWVQIFFLYVTLLNNFVPLSLYVTVEVVTLCLRIFINLDVRMYDPISNTRTVARSTTVTDLGQVQYVFSDKTGTLTQNVMRFKRCSVDGLVFGAPVEKATPGAAQEDEAAGRTAFHPLKQLLVGQISIPPPPRSGGARQASAGLQSLGGTESIDHQGIEVSAASNTLTFNAEMFLRVMSLCHTVVVEKDFDAKRGVIKSESTTSESSGLGSTLRKLLFGEKSSTSSGDEMPQAEEEEEEAPAVDAPAPGAKGKDGAPSGFAFQAESPDEGALVQAASLKFNFQVVGRDSSGIRLACTSPSLLAEQRIQDGIRDGSLTAKQLAAETASPMAATLDVDPPNLRAEPNFETWSVLAVNKFDSTRKRMSVLVRSPPELGSIPMILCKGADSAMLDKSVLKTSTYVMSGEEDDADIVRHGEDAQNEDDQEDWERSGMLGLQSHLGEFAREGLRTLVLAVRILSEDECTGWLQEYTAAATSIKNRDEKLTQAALSIETSLHIVGATAIEDKLQVGVPETIANLGRAGIKLWVLTGDKRETAKEIGYATKVLTEKMRPGLIEVAKAPALDVQTRMSMEFLKLVKFAKLPEYQKAAVGEEHDKTSEKILFRLGKMKRAMGRSLRKFFHGYIKPIFLFCLSEVPKVDPKIVEIDAEAANEEHILRLTERRRGVRERAETIVREFLDSDEGRRQREQRAIARSGGDDFSVGELSLQSDNGPDAFSRAHSANRVMSHRRIQGNTSQAEVRDLSLANVTAHEAALGTGPVVDEEVLSMQSHLPADGEAGKEDFDRMKRTLLERVFAADHAVRHGRLVKHLNREKLEAIAEDRAQPSSRRLEPAVVQDGPRALVIEGAALESLLGDPQLEELLFAVVSTCKSVIACRVSPAQKAQLVQLVRRYVVPEPVTLAIGDGANDVGMIQEAHVGIGISGKEGQQAVNASDFAIAQFRFLEELLLIHGRWSFFRLSTVVMFSFYKNAVMAGCLVAYSAQTLYSGTPLFDEWVIAVLNFVAAAPIGALGLFDRCLDKDYIRAHPEVYTPTRRNELMTFRILSRWVILVFIHVFTLYYLTVFPLSDGGGVSAAFAGLMANNDPNTPGDGEGGDLKSIGLVTFSAMIVLLSLKVSCEDSWSRHVVARNNSTSFTR